MNIKEIDSLIQASKSLQAADTNSLVIFDIDDTLITPTDNFKIYWEIIKCNAEKDFAQEDIAFVKKIQQNLNMHLLKEEEKHLSTVFGEHITSKIFAKYDIQPIEKCTLQVLNDLQARNIKNIALTFQWTDQYGEINSMKEWRIQKLSPLGINFDQNFKEHEIIFDNFQTPEDKHPPVFYKGILMTGLKSKGEVLGDFFDRIKWTPSNIIFFDDKKIQLESVEQEMAKRNIHFTGYWYKGAKKLKTLEPLNQNIVQLQFDYLKKYNEILSYAEAESLIHKNLSQKNKLAGTKSTLGY